MKIANVIYLIFTCICLLLSIVSCNYRSSAIDSERTKQLEYYVYNIEDTKFKEYYQNKILNFSQDSKISNSEFIELEELYNKYVTSKALNTNILPNLQEKDKKNEELSDIIYYVFCLFISLLLITIPIFMVRV